MGAWFKKNITRGKLKNKNGIQDSTKQNNSKMIDFNLKSLGIMEENSMVRELITKILDESVPTETSTSSTSPSDDMSLLPPSTNVTQYPKNDAPTSYQSPAFNGYQDNNLFHYSQQTNEQSPFNFSVQNGFGNSNGYGYSDTDATLLALDPVAEVSTEAVTPEHLNLLRLAAQEIGGAQFTTPNKFDDKYNYNFYEPSQRNSLPEASMFSNNFNRPTSLNLDMNYNTNFDNPYGNGQRFPQNKFENYIKDQSQDSTELASYINQLSLAPDRVRDETAFQNNDYKMALEMNGHYDEYKLQEERNKMALFNRNYVLQNKNFNGDNNNFFINDMISQMGDRSPMNQNYEFPNQSPVQNMNYKPNGFHPQSEFMQRRDMKMMQNGYQNGTERMNYDGGLTRESQQAAIMRQNQEVARQMGLMMRNGPPPPANQLNVDVTFLHENNPYNIANIGAMLAAPTPTVPPPMVQSPMHDIPLLMPYYAMRGMRSTASSASILHARLDASHEQWKQLERERKRTEARLALAYPGRAVSSANSIPVPRLSQCPSRLERVAVDMYREHTKVVTLMGKMETLRAGACVAQNRRPNKPDDAKITVLKRGQEVLEDKEVTVDPSTFDPSTWREDVKNLPTSPHKDIETALVKWKSSVDYVLALRKRELNPHSAPPIPHANHLRFMRDPALEMAEALRAMCKFARRVRCAMWYDLTLTVALAPSHNMPLNNPLAEKSPQSTSAAVSPKQPQDLKASQPASPSNANTSNISPKADAKVEAKEEKPASETQQKPAATTTTTPSTTTTENQDTKPTTKPADKPNQRKPQYRHKVQRNDFYKHQRYDHRFVHRHPYYLATGPIN